MLTSRRSLFRIIGLGVGGMIGSLLPRSVSDGEQPQVTTDPPTIRDWWEAQYREWPGWRPNG